MVLGQQREMERQVEPPRGGDALVGVWEIAEARHDGLRAPGRLPRACILFTPARRFMALLDGHEPGAKDVGEILAAFREAFAFSGRYRVVGEAFVISRRRNWNDVAEEGELFHFFRADGDTLHLRPGRWEFTFRRVT